MDLGGLPGELLTEIARRLPCRADLVALTAALRRPIAPPTPRPALPWLLVPHSSAPVLAPGEARTARFVCIGYGGPHHLRVPEELAAGRLFGTYPPGWVFLAGAQDADHALVNLYTRTRLLIPDFLTMAGDTTGQPRQIVMLAAALSAEPLSPGNICFGAAIVGALGGAPVFALWALVRAACHERLVAHGFHVAVGAGAGLQHQQLFLEDVAYHRGTFYFLTSQEQVVAVQVVDDGKQLLARQHLIEHRRPPNPPGLLVSSRYLLASNGGWAMVVRYHCPPLPGDRAPGPAMRFTLYRGQIHQGDAFTTWTEVQPESLQGLLVFAARGCSSLIDDRSGLYNLQAGVRYLDDRDARDMGMIREEDPSRREYRCSETCGFGWPPAAIHFYASWVNYPPIDLFFADLGLSLGVSLV